VFVNLIVELNSLNLYFVIAVVNVIEILMAFVLVVGVIVHVTVHVSVQTEVVIY